MRLGAQAEALDGRGQSAQGHGPGVGRSAPVVGGHGQAQALGCLAQHRPRVVAAVHGRHAAVAELVTPLADQAQAQRVEGGDVDLVGQRAEHAG